jgi:hypothetical protein
MVMDEKAEYTGAFVGETGFEPVDMNLQQYLKAGYPNAFVGWDGFEFNIQSRIRNGDPKDGIIAVTLYNKGNAGYVVDLHACFLMTMDDKGNEVIRVGKEELATEYNHAYLPDYLL